MLSIAAVHRGGAREQYYEQEIADDRELYYAGREAPDGSGGDVEGEPVGRWTGSGARSLGLSGDVSVGALREMWEGRVPGSGDQLRRMPPKGAVSAFDLTLRPPKSVSVIFALADRETRAVVGAAHDAAVDETLGYLERHACFVRRGHAGLVRQPGDGFLVAAFQHHSSRAGDPLLHTHAVVANMARGPDGRWTALDGRALFGQAKTAGYLYQASLRAQLSRVLGVEWGPVREGSAEIQGVPRGVVDHFSRRRAEVVEAMAAEGGGSARAAQLATIRTRRAKQDVDPGRQRAEWRARATEFGFGQDQLHSLLGRESRAPSRADLARQGEWMAGPEGLTRRQSTFDRRDVVRELAAFHRGGARVERLEGLADRWLSSKLVKEVEPEELTSASVIRRGDGRVAPAYFGARYSTKDMLRVERELVAAAARRRCEGAGVARSGAVEAALARRPSMRDEQAEMVRSVCRSGAGVQVVRGRAGTGKTYALAAAREAWEQSGVPVGGVALSASSARLLESETGIASRTVAQLKAEIERWGGLDGAMAGGVLVVDEAAMVGTRGLKLLIDAAGELGVAVRLVGDDAQLPEIDAGGALRALAEREGAVELRRVRRQSDRQLRLALEDLRVGEGERYLAGAVERGAVTIAQTPEAQRAAAVERWWADAQEHGHERSVLLAARHSHRRELNELARERMRTAGLLGERELQVGGLAFSVGDRVVALRNRRSVGLLNGDRGTVGALDEDGLRIGLDDGRQVRVGLDYLQGRHLDLGYAMTVHKAQGQTFERAHFLGDEGVYRELAYTAATRGRQETRFYFVAPDPGRSRPGRGADEDGLAALARGLSESRAKELALEAQARAQAGPEGPNGDRDWERFRAAPARGPEGRPEDPRRTPPPDPPHVAARRAERDRLAAVVDTFPSVAAGALQAHQEEIDKRGRWAEQEQAKAQRCREELARLGPLARRGERGRELRDRIAGHEQVVANLRRGQHTAQAEIERIQRGPDSPARWEAEHPDARERLQAAERAFDAAVEREAARAIEHPAEHLTRVLGEPPARQDATRREVWLQAAQAVERYRITHQIDPAEPTALGPTPEPGRGSWDRPYDWRRAGERLLEAREQLGIAHSGSGSLEERLARVEGLMPERDRQRTVERDLGRGI